MVKNKTLECYCGIVDDNGIDIIKYFDDMIYFIKVLGLRCIFNSHRNSTQFISLLENKDAKKIISLLHKDPKKAHKELIAKAHYLIVIGDEKNNKNEMNEELAMIIINQLRKNEMLKNL